MKPLVTCVAITYIGLNHDFVGGTIEAIMFLPKAEMEGLRKREPDALYSILQFERALYSIHTLDASTIEVFHRNDPGFEGALDRAANAQNWGAGNTCVGYNIRNLHFSISL